MPASNQVPMPERHIDLDHRYASRHLSVVGLHIGALDCRSRRCGCEQRAMTVTT
jgi:hypothetical protein